MTFVKLIICCTIILGGIISFPAFSQQVQKACCPLKAKFSANGICCNGPNEVKSNGSVEFNDTCCKEGAKRKGYNEVNIIKDANGKKKCCLVKNPQQS